MNDLEAFFFEISEDWYDINENQKSNMEILRKTPAPPTNEPEKTETHKTNCPPPTQKKKKKKKNPPIGSLIIPIRLHNQPA